MIFLLILYFLKRKFSKVEFGLDLVRQRLLCCAYSKLSVQELKEFEAECTKPADPSVEFFGLEWTSVFSRCYALGVEVRLFKAGLQQDYLSRDRLALCLSLIHQLRTELELHVTAVKFERLSSIQQSMRLLQQQQNRVKDIGRTASFKQLDSTPSSRHVNKYKGSKTDSALVHASTNKSSASRSQKRKQRKSSFIDAIFNLA